MNPDETENIARGLEAKPSEEVDGPRLESPLPIAPVGETYEQYLERVAEVMGRLSRDENLRRFYARRLS